MNQSEFALLRSYLEEKDRPVPLKDLFEKSLATLGEIILLEINGAVFRWFKPANQDAPVELAKNILPEYRNAAEKILDYLRMEPDGMAREDELKNILGMTKCDSQYVTMSLLDCGLLDMFVSITPPASCGLCVNRERCKTAPENGGREKTRGKACHLFRDDRGAAAPVRKE